MNIFLHPGEVRMLVDPYLVVGILGCMLYWLMFGQGKPGTAPSPIVECRGFLALLGTELRKLGSLVWGPSCFQGGGVSMIDFSVFSCMFTCSRVLTPQFLTPHLYTLAKVLGFIRGPGSPISAAYLQPFWVPEALPSPCVSSCSDVYTILIVLFMFSICQSNSSWHMCLFCRALSPPACSNIWGHLFRSVLTCSLCPYGPIARLLAYQSHTDRMPHLPAFTSPVEGHL